MFRWRKASSSLMAEEEILFDAVNVGGSEERRLPQRPAAFGAFALKQMAPACPSEQDLAGSSYLETFGHRFSGFNAFGASHISSLSSKDSETIRPVTMG
jgi:hypothetical protein